MSFVNGTQSIYRVQGTKEQRFCTSSRNYILHTFNQQCSCTNCIADPEDINKYHYIQHRNWKEVIVREKEKPRDTLTREEEYQRLPVNKLKISCVNKNYQYQDKKMSQLQDFLTATAITTMTQYYLIPQNKTTIKTSNKTLTTAASAVLPTRKMNQLYRIFVCLQI